MVPVTPSISTLLTLPAEFAISKLRYHDINVPGTFEYRVSFSYNHKPISPWHDIPLFPHNAPEDEVHFICEIPKYLLFSLFSPNTRCRYTRAKFEIATGHTLPMCNAHCVQMSL